MNKTIKIGNRTLGHGQPCFLIAEMSANHGGSFEHAVKILQAAKKAGADAVKLQTYTADTITLNCRNPDFLIPSDSPWSQQETLHSLYSQAFTPWEWHENLFHEAKKCGLEIFSSPFDLSAVDFLEDLDVVAYKIASPEITDIPLIQKIALTKKPVFISTGLATAEDIQLALDTLKTNGASEIILLKCTTSYPAPIREANLLTIPDMAQRFDCLAGLSDHTPGSIAPIVAATLGAAAIEKHFIIDKTDNSVDAFFSLDQEEFAQMVKDVRTAEESLGKIDYSITGSAEKSLRGRRSLYVSRDIRKGEAFSHDNIKSVRPAMGLHPKYHDEIIGKRAKTDLKLGDRVSWDVIER